MPLNIGDPAPQFTAVDVIDGQTHSLSDYAGQVVLLVFSGPSWCGPCIFEAPILEELWQTFKSSYLLPKVKFLMISCCEAQESPDAFKQAVQNLGLTFPALLNPNNTISNLYGVGGVPSLFVVDTEQKICAKESGASPPAEAVYEEIFNMLIGCGVPVPHTLPDLSRWRAIVTILFGVIQDGGGLAVTPGGKPIPIDPWGPLRRMAAEKRDLYTSLAIAELTGSLKDGAAAYEIRTAALRSAEAAMRTIVAKGSIPPPEAGTVQARSTAR